MTTSSLGLGCLLAAFLIPAGNAQATEASAAAAGQSASVTADQLLAIAERAEAEGDLSMAEKAYRALVADPSVEVRSEARFRLAIMFAGQRSFAAAAILLREILDEQAGAQRVRLELARVLALMGDEAGARRALREAQAGGLPPEVARLVDRYSAALRARKAIGGSIEIALAPDSNINRATRSDTLGTVLGDFELDEDAKQRSGIGLALRGQGYARLPLGETPNLFGRVSSSADLYRDGDFNDVALAATIGPELHVGTDRLSLEGGRIWRWFGGEPYSGAWTVGLNYFRPLGRRAQLRGMASVAFIDNRLNELQDGEAYSASLSFERALSSRAGIRFTLSADRQALREPGYSTWGGRATLFGYRELGSITLVATLEHGRLKADERLALLSEARFDRLYRASLSATFRNFRIGTFAPLVRATYERSQSTIEIYDFRKLRTEIGLTRAF